MDSEREWCECGGVFREVGFSLPDKNDGMSWHPTTTYGDASATCVFARGDRTEERARRWKLMRRLWRVVAKRPCREGSRGSKRPIYYSPALSATWSVSRHSSSASTYPTEGRLDDPWFYAVGIPSQWYGLAYGALIDESALPTGHVIWRSIGSRRKRFSKCERYHDKRHQSPVHKFTQSLLDDIRPFPRICLALWTFPYPLWRCPSGGSK